MKTAAIIPFVLQGISVFGGIVNGSLLGMITGCFESVYAIFEWIGFFIPKFCVQKQTQKSP